MAVKKKDFTPEQQLIMARDGKDYRYYELVNDLPRSMTVRNKITKEVTIVRKYQIPKRLGS